MTNLEKLDTLPELRAELEREKEARWQAEKHCIDADRSAAAAANRAEMLLARAEQAEKERDEALDRIEAWKDASGLLVGEDPDGVTPAMLAKDLRQREREFNAEKAARERAEADNVALRKHEAEIAESLRNALERLRALDGLRKAAEDALECMEEDWPTRPATMSLRRACITADALKERKP